MLADLILRSSLRTCVREYSFSNFYAKRFTCGQLQQCTYVHTGLIFSRIVFFFLSLYLIANVEHKISSRNSNYWDYSVRRIFFFFFFFNCKRLERLKERRRDRNLIVAKEYAYLSHFLSFFVSKYFPAPIIFPHFHIPLFQNFTSYRSFVNNLLFIIYNLLTTRFLPLSLFLSLSLPSLSLSLEYISYIVYRFIR